MSVSSTQLNRFQLLSNEEKVDFKNECDSFFHDDDESDAGSEMSNSNSNSSVCSDESSVTTTDTNRSRKRRKRKKKKKSPDEYIEKEFYVRELRRFNIPCSTSESLEELKFKYFRKKQDENASSTVQFMSDCLKMGFGGIECLNNWAGPVLALDGWSAKMSSHESMQRYQGALTRIYRRYFRKGTSINPVVELGFLILSSALITHFENKYYHNNNASNIPSNIPTSSDTPFTFKRATMKRVQKEE